MIWREKILYSTMLATWRICNCVDNPRQQQFLIFINPFGGQGSAKNIFEKNIKPMLNDANVDFDTKITGMFCFICFILLKLTWIDNLLYLAHKGHAQEIIENMNDLKKYDCIVCCSGDGIVNEVRIVG